jgi:phosphogluconate dehydratase
VARAAGIHINWDDFSALSAAVPLLARVYPNGQADVNQFQAAGGPGWVIRELLAGGCMHPDVATISGAALADYTQVPSLDSHHTLRWSALPEAPCDNSVVRPINQPFSPSGGLKLLTGNLGRSVIKVSSVPEANHIVQAPARVFDSQSDFMAAFQAGELACDGVAVLRFQGPRANGMPELHQLTPPLSVLQGQGYQVALVTDGRMSGASGKVPAAIHLSPEALAQGPLAKVRTGDLIRLDAVAGTLDALVDPATWSAREPAQPGAAYAEDHHHGMGRELFRGLRQHVSSAEAGATTWLPL